MEDREREGKGEKKALFFLIENKLDTNWPMWSTLSHLVIWHTLLENKVFIVAYYFIPLL
jgi:hypothetical protein